MNSYPSPTTLTYAWNLGFIALTAMVIQVLTGVFLAMHYVPHTSLAYDSIEHILRDTQSGWLLRYAHSNGASGYFVVLYLHLLRGLYYGSYLQPRHTIWVIGIAILLLSILTAFIGYVLPWGQMSLWGATVITSLATAIPYVGHTLVIWLWGGYAIEQATLNRFYALHYLLPFIVIALVLLHLQQLHLSHSSAPQPQNTPTESLALLPYYSVKDVVGLCWYLILYIAILGYYSEVLGHSDNTIPANPLSTPLHIVPEWYFLHYYAILRSIPHKLLGVLAMITSILLLAILPWLQHRSHRSPLYQPIQIQLFHLQLVTFLLLGILGHKPVEYPYVILGQLLTLQYFLQYLVLIPLSDSLLKSTHASFAKTAVLTTASMLLHLACQTISPRIHYSAQPNLRYLLKLP